MSNPNDPQGAAAPGAEPVAPAGEPAPLGPAASASAAADPNAAALVQAFELLKAENADLKDRLLRAHAEMENIRKRTERERAEAHKYAITKFAKDIVTVGDNFQRAIESVPSDAIAAAPALQSLVEGVTMTERELLNALERHGVRRIDPKGQPFNPHQHQAVMEQPNPDVPSGTVTQVFQLGFMIEDRVLRPAMVVVAKGGFKPVKPVEPTAAPSAADALPLAADDDVPPAGGNA